MKKFLLIMFLMLFISIEGVNADISCYEKCETSTAFGKTCTYTTKCSSSDKVSCIEVDEINCSGGKVSCGSGEGKLTGIPKKIPELTSFAMSLLQVAIPVILVIFGTIDLFKGIMSSKEDEIKKGQHVFIKRLILAAIIFFIVVIVKILISIIADTSKTNLVDCIDCFVSNDCKDKTKDLNLVCGIDGYQLTYLNGNLKKVSKDGKKLDYRLKSDFHPKKKSQCPTKKNSSIEFIDDGKTLYVKSS